MYSVFIYDLSVLSVSRMGFQKKKLWVGGWVELYPNFFWIIGIFLTLQSPLESALKSKMAAISMETNRGKNTYFRILFHNFSH